MHSIIFSATVHSHGIIPRRVEPIRSLTPCSHTYKRIAEHSIPRRRRGTPAIEDATQFNGDVKRLRIEIQEGHVARESRRSLSSFFFPPTPSVPLHRKLERAVPTFIRIRISNTDTQWNGRGSGVSRVGRADSVLLHPWPAHGTRWPG